MRRVHAPLAGLFLFATTACGGGDGSGPAAQPPAASVPAANGSADGLPDKKANESTPDCPFETAQVSDLVGESMYADGRCLWRSDESAALVTITMVSAATGVVTYDMSRRMAESTYERVLDLDEVKHGYIAIGETGAELNVVRDQGNFTVGLSSFEFDHQKYEQVARAVLAELPR
jgi:hypothetical protein